MADGIGSAGLSDCGRDLGVREGFADGSAERGSCGCRSEGFTITSFIGLRCGFSALCSGRLRSERRSSHKDTPEFRPFDRPLSYDAPSPQ
jgi:hypothetical protein